jgi:hypothetical protein
MEAEMDRWRDEVVNSKHGMTKVKVYVRESESVSESRSVKSEWTRNSRRKCDVYGWPGGSSVDM